MHDVIQNEGIKKHLRNSKISAGYVKGKQINYNDFYLFLSFFPVSLFLSNTLNDLTLLCTSL